MEAKNTLTSEAAAKLEQFLSKDSPEMLSSVDFSKTVVTSSYQESKSDKSQTVGLTSEEQENMSLAEAKRHDQLMSFTTVSFLR